jgi:hypothetical protein
MIHTSSTIAFMKAKKSNARFMTIPDLKRILNNLNIEPPDAIIERIYRDMDDDGDGLVECSEFLSYFGNYINGFAGSFETKPDWFYKELSDLSAHIDKIEGMHVSGPETVVVETEKPKLKAAEKLSKQQELRFTRKFGISPEDLEYMNSENTPLAPQPQQNVNVNILELNPSPMARPQSAGRDRPRSAGGNPRTKSDATQGGGGGGGPSWGQQRTSDRPRSAGSARPQSAGQTRSSKSARNIQSAVNFSTATMGMQDLDDDPFSALLQPVMTSTNNNNKNRTASFIAEPSPNQENDEPLTSPGTNISEFSDGALLKELRERKQKKEGSFRSKSLEKSKRGEIDSGWEKPSSRFGGFNQGPHFKSTVASKLKAAKKIAAMLEKNSKYCTCAFE